MWFTYNGGEDKTEEYENSQGVQKYCYGKIWYNNNNNNNNNNNCILYINHTLCREDIP